MSRTFPAACISTTSPQPNTTEAARKEEAAAAKQKEEEDKAAAKDADEKIAQYESMWKKDAKQDLAEISTKNRSKSKLPPGEIPCLSCSKRGQRLGQRRQRRGDLRRKGPRC